MIHFINLKRRRKINPKQLNSTNKSPNYTPFPLVNGPIPGPNLKNSAKHSVRKRKSSKPKKQLLKKFARAVGYISTCYPKQRKIV